MTFELDLEGQNRFFSKSKTKGGWGREGDRFGCGQRAQCVWWFLEKPALRDTSRGVGVRTGYVSLRIAVGYGGDELVKSVGARWRRRIWKATQRS